MAAKKLVVLESVVEVLDGPSPFQETPPHLLDTQAKDAARAAGHPELADAPGEGSVPDVPADQTPILADPDLLP